MIFSKRMVTIICLIFLGAGPGLAQQDNAQQNHQQKMESSSQKTTELAQVVVSAKKPMNAGADFIDQEKIQLPLVSCNLIDALGSQAGIQLKRSTRSGSDRNQLRMRGFDETRLLIMKDNVSLKRDGSYGNGPVDWGSLSPGSIREIEIYRGACPAKYGNTLGGVINLITNHPSQDPSTQLSLSYGSLDTLSANISHNWQKKYWDGPFLPAI